MRKLRLAIARLRCRRSGHIGRCSIVVEAGLGIQTHTHACQRCGEVTKREITPVTEDIMRFLAEAGMPLSDQRSALVN